MQEQRSRRPSPALIVAMVALFVALGGTAGAVVTAAVPLAKRALVADKAKVATTAKTANLAKVATTAKSATTAQTASTATNANALGGQTAAQIIAAASTAGTQGALAVSPAGARPASTAAGLVSIKTATDTLAAAEEKSVVVTCDPGKRAIAGGFSSSGIVMAFDSFPSSGQAWTFFLVNLDDVNSAGIAAHAICLG